MTIIDRKNLKAASGGGYSKARRTGGLRASSSRVAAKLAPAIANVRKTAGRG
jgi:hypothetical protein|tara:strand:- start:173 stop:328 length:156 start_codon:yes stop_codon:yes gene_type:complete